MLEQRTYVERDGLGDQLLHLVTTFADSYAAWKFGYVGTPRVPVPLDTTMYSVTLVPS